MATTDRIPRVASVNTALRSSFFTVVLLSSVLGLPGGNPSFIGWMIKARFEPEEKPDQNSAEPVKQLWNGSVSKVTSNAKFLLRLFRNPEFVKLPRAITDRSGMKSKDK